MSIQIVAVRYEQNKAKIHEAIVRYKWVEDGTSNSRDNDKPTLVDWLDNKNVKAYVGSGSNRVAVRVVHPTSGKPYLQTHADGRLTNNLTTLPEF